MADEKANLRIVLGECRLALGADFAKSASREVQAHVLSFDPYLGAATVVLYAAAHKEVATDAILADALARRRRVLFPRIDQAHGAIALAEVRDPGELRAATFGIRQPPASAPPVAPSELHDAIVCVPALGFGSNGARLGRGGGHYDRLLAELDSQAITVGLAYSFQMLDRMPESGSDRRLNYIVTETAVYPAYQSTRAGRGHVEQGGMARWKG
ncbi:MAG: 5-formyltetrahydrofolate cyclo-ligase [Candidatus Binataceae bacterium]